MEPFVSVQEIAAPLRRSNVDTDAIIPVIFMRGSTKDVSHGLFGLWRREADGQERADFVLNLPQFRDARILVTGPNFGCGSSREAAVWALTYAGFRCVIAPSFGDIFYENALRNGLLPAIVGEADVEKISAYLDHAVNPSLLVDLPGQLISWPDGSSIPFAIPEIRKEALIAGLDEIDATLQRVDELSSFRARDALARPWIYARNANPAL